MEETKKSFVAFIDILGFKEMVDEYYNGNNRAILQILKDTLGKAEDEVIGKSNDEFKASPLLKIKFKQFSDSVSLSFPLAFEAFFLPQVLTFLSIVSSYQRLLMENSIFCRGGIAFAAHYEDDSFIFSKSLIAAYNNEIEIAIYPRIVIDKTFIDEIKSALEPKALHKFHTAVSTYIIQDWDGIHFVNPFDYFSYINILPNNDGLTDKVIEIRRQYIEKHYNRFNNILQTVEMNIEKYKDNYTILKKYLWLREFLVWHNDPTKSRIVFEKMT